MERQTLNPAKRKGIAVPLRRFPAMLLQRKCACGGSAASGGNCEECKEKKLQRRATGANGPSAVPSIVRDVLRSPGWPLDGQTRGFYEPRFGHDFSKVRVHTDEKASESARAVNAVAYTVGRNVVFAAGQYAPGTIAGQRLLAHELTHVIQQGADEVSHLPFTVGAPEDTYEQQAERISSVVVGAGPALGFSRQTGAGTAAARVTPLRVPGATAVIQRQIPTGISLKEIKPFGHADLKDDENKKKFLTNIGAVTLMQLTPAGDYSAGQKAGDCTKEFLTEVANTCPAAKKPFCSGDKCLEVGTGSSGDPETGMMVTRGPDAFIDRHIARYDTSLLAGSGKKQCSVVCHQLYKYRTGADKKYHELGAFYIIRNFKADTYTPKGGTPLNITTGNIQKVTAAAAPSKESFAKDVAPGLVKSGALLEAPPVPKPAAKTEEKK